MKYLQRDMAASQEMVTEASEKKATAEGGLATAKQSSSESVRGFTRSGKSSEALALKDLQGTCLKKAAKFEEDMQARAEEIKALGHCASEDGFCQALQDAKDAVSAKMGSTWLRAFMTFSRVENSLLPAEAVGEVSFLQLSRGVGFLKQT